ncbi:MAG: putative bifunctional diguanylate cyclase/phosphodiesterase [Gaiella sp.]
MPVRPRSPDRWWRPLALVSGSLYVVTGLLSVAAAWVEALGGAHGAHYLVLAGCHVAIGCALLTIRRPIPVPALHLQGFAGTTLLAVAIGLGDPVWPAYVPFFGWLLVTFALLAGARGLAMQMAAAVIACAAAISVHPSWAGVSGVASALLAAAGISVFVFRGRTLIGRRLRLERDRLELDLESELAKRVLDEARFESLVQSIPGVVYRRSAPGWKARFESEAVRELTGYGPGEADLVTLIEPDDRKQAVAAWEAAAAAREPLQVTYRIRHRDGTTRWVEDWARPGEGVDGPVLEGVLFDVTAEVTARGEAELAREEFRRLVETIPLVTYTDRLESHAPTAYMSPQLEALLGYTVEEWLNDEQLWVKLLHPDDRARAVGENEAHITSGRPYRMEYRLQTKDGGWRWFLDEAVIVRDEEGNPVASKGFLMDITDRKLLEQQLTFQAFHDSLTGLANRALFRDRLEHALTRRRAGPISVVYVDLDDFKAVNDSLGHGVGDDVIRTAAERILRAVRRSDTVARLGGDEFAILVEDDAELATSRVAQAVLEEFRRPVSAGGRQFELTASVGVAISDRELEAEALIQHADLAMYAAKSRGKGRIEEYTDDLSGRARDRLEVRTDLKRALHDGELEMFFQPIVDLERSRTVGAEALMRWNHPEKGWVPPIDFIPIAEEAGLVVELGRWAIERAVLAGVEMREALEQPDFFMSVNVSARELMEEDLATFISRQVASSGLGLDGLVVEMTESMLLSEPEVAIDRLSALRRAGLKVALDDFGTGYSSLSYLARMPVDTLKVAKPFVDALGTASREERLVAAVVGLCRDLELRVIAEGIERIEQADELRRLGCELGQGFLFAPPQSLQSFLALDHAAHLPRRRGKLRLASGDA